MDCIVIGQKMTILIQEFTRAQDVFRWTINNIRNAGSTKPYALLDLHFVDSEGYIVSSTTGDVLVTNREPATLESYSINQDD